MTPKTKKIIRITLCVESACFVILAFIINTNLLLLACLLYTIHFFFKDDQTGAPSQETLPKANRNEEKSTINCYTNAQVDNMITHAKTLNQSCEIITDQNKGNMDKQDEKKLKEIEKITEKYIKDLERIKEP